MFSYCSTFSSSYFSSWARPDQFCCVGCMTKFEKIDFFLSTTVFSIFSTSSSTSIWLLTVRVFTGAYIFSCSITASIDLLGGLPVSSINLHPLYLIISIYIKFSWSHVQTISTFTVPLICSFLTLSILVNLKKNPSIITSPAFGSASLGFRD